MGKRDTRTAYRARAAATERLINEAVAALRAERDAEHTARMQANREAEASRVRFTREDLTEAIIVRTVHGWHKVAKLNAKTVSVETGYSWTDRIEFDKILDYRKAA